MYHSLQPYDVKAVNDSALPLLFIYFSIQIARFKRQRAAESKLLEIKESKERRMRSTRASALSTPVEAEEEDVLDYDGEEEREVNSCSSLVINNINLILNIVNNSLFTLLRTIGNCKLIFYT